MTYLIHFLIAIGLSFIGSLPFGMINMTVAHTAMRRGMKAALSAAFGASLVEFFQVFLSLKFISLFAENATLERIFQSVAVVVFLAGGIYFFFFAKAKAPDVQEVADEKRWVGYFLKGALVSILNLMAIPYWVFYGTLLIGKGWLLPDDLHLMFFAAGTLVGTFLLMVLYALLGAKILVKSELITRRVNQFIGLLMLGFAVYQLGDLLIW